MVSILRELTMTNDKNDRNENTDQTILIDSSSMFSPLLVNDDSDDSFRIKDNQSIHNGNNNGNSNNGNNNSKNENKKSSRENLSITTSISSLSSHNNSPEKKKNYSNNTNNDSRNNSNNSSPSKQSNLLHSGRVLGDLPSLDNRADNKDKNNRISSSSGYNRKNKNKLKNAYVPPKDLPVSFICQLSQKMMSDPVKSAYGNIYDRAVIMQWMNKQGHICPLTGEKYIIWLLLLLLSFFLL